MCRNFLNKKGFSLIEVLAALVLISIILLSLMNMLVSNYATSYRNLDKLMTTQLADTYLARASNMPLSFATAPTVQELQNHIATSTEFPKEENLNGDRYIIAYQIKQSTSTNTTTNLSEKQLNLYTLVVEVTKQGTPVKSKTEGYIRFEKPSP